jgi:hypothetical protein
MTPGEQRTFKQTCPVCSNAFFYGPSMGHGPVAPTFPAHPNRQGIAARASGLGSGWMGRQHGLANESDGA